MTMEINDFEHKVTNVIKEHGNEPSFPKMDDYGFTSKELDDYLFDKQALLDKKDERKKKYTIPAMVFLIPILVLSALPSFEGTNALFVGMGLGFVFLLIYFVFCKIMDKNKMRSLYNQNIEKYIKDIFKFVEK
jgi:hypothetical protein